MSIFNTDIIKDVNLYKGAFPLQYGGKLSSVIDITTREGNQHQRKSSFGISLLGCRALTEGYIGKKTTYIVAGRASYAGVAQLVQQYFYQKRKIDHFTQYWLYDVI
jgi:hypothetical protein